MLRRHHHAPGIRVGAVALVDVGQARQVEEQGQDCEGTSLCQVGIEQARQPGARGIDERPGLAGGPALWRQLGFDLARSHLPGTMSPLAVTVCWGCPCCSCVWTWNALAGSGVCGRVIGLPSTMRRMFSSSIASSMAPG